MGWASLARIVGCRLKWGLPRSILRRLARTPRAAGALNVVLRSSGLLVLGILACVGATPAPASSQTAAAARCELPEPTVLRREGNTVLHVWELSAAPAWFGETVPDAAGYLAYRAAIRAAGGDLPRPMADPPQPKDDAERELWGREDSNAALMYAGSGEVRRIRCLEAALFALQDARYSELTRPTEFIAHILRRNDRLKVYFGASDLMFPPKNFYGLEEVAAEVRAGWQYWVVLHNHTVRTLDGRPALGTPAPSTSDVQLFKGLVENLGLREVWITNGMYTGVVTSENLGRFSTRQ